MPPGPTPKKEPKTAYCWTRPRGRHVVEMAMGMEEGLDLEALHAGEDLLGVVARIDDDGLARALVAEDVAVAAQRADRRRLVDQAFGASAASHVSTRLEIFIEQNFGPHMEQNSALLK
jgi:hypothetical protein